MDSGDGPTTKTVRRRKTDESEYEPYVFQTIIPNDDAACYRLVNNRKCFGFATNSTLKLNPCDCHKCVVCVYKDSTTYNLILGTNWLVACCTGCLTKLSKLTDNDFEIIRDIMRDRVDFRIREPLLYGEDRIAFKNIEREKYYKTDLYSSTYNKLATNYGKRLKFNEHFEYLQTVKGITVMDYNSKYTGKRKRNDDVGTTTTTTTTRGLKKKIVNS